MKITLSYDWVSEVELADNQVMGVYAPREVPVQDPNRLIKEALQNPIGTPALDALLQDISKQGGKVLIVVDDITRNTPVQSLLPWLLGFVKAAGIPNNQVRILIGCGSHRALTHEEIKKQVGAEVVAKYQVINHDAKKEADLVTIGTASDGTEIKVNRLALESDFVMTLGQIAPHRVAGFSGGSKMIQPGICDTGITASVHWRGWQTKTEEIFGIRDNAIRREMDQIAAKVGLNFIINVIMAPQGGIAKIVAGDFIQAHQNGCDAALSIYSVPVKQADIVIIDSYPCDIDLWQAAKAISPAELVMKENGATILVTPCPEGISPSYPQIEEIGYMPMKKILEKVKTGEITDSIISSHLAAVGRILERGKLILVSPGFTPEKVKKIGLEYAPTVQEAVNREVERLGKAATISVLKQGGKIFPKVK